MGLFRYTIKLSEYLATGLTIVTGRLPFAYDLSEPRIRRIPGAMPWHDQYVRALAEFMQSAEIPSGARDPRGSDAFDPVKQEARVRAFISDILDES